MIEHLELSGFEIDEADQVIEEETAGPVGAGSSPTLRGPGGLPEPLRLAAWPVSPSWPPRSGRCGSSLPRALARLRWAPSSSRSRSIVDNVGPSRGEQKGPWMVLERRPGTCAAARVQHLEAGRVSRAYCATILSMSERSRACAPDRQPWPRQCRQHVRGCRPWRALRRTEVGTNMGVGFRENIFRCSGLAYMLAETGGFEPPIGV